MPGAGTLLFMKYYKRDPITKKQISSHNVLIAVYEKGGRYAGTYNLPAGNWEQSDGLYNGTPNLFRTAIREVSEEIGPIPKLMNGFAQPRKPDLLMGQTGIYIVPVESGVSRRDFVPNEETGGIEFLDLDSLISEAKRNKALYVVGAGAGAANNLLKLPLGTIGHCSTIDGKKVPISKFILEAIMFWFDSLY